MRKLISSERGLTLVEVLVTLVIMSIVSGVIYSVFTTGLKLYQKIGIEAQLRDDADYIATMILNEMYNYPPNFIKKYEEDGAEGIELIRFAPKNVEGYVVEDSTKIERDLLIYFKDNHFFIDEIKRVTEAGTEKINILNSTKLSSESSKFTTVNGQSSSISVSCTKPELANQCPHGTIALNIFISEDKERFSNLLKTEPLELKSSFGF